MERLSNNPRKMVSTYQKSNAKGNAAEHIKDGKAKKLSDKQKKKAKKVELESSIAANHTANPSGRMSLMQGGIQTKDIAKMNVRGGVQKEMKEHHESVMREFQNAYPYLQNREISWLEFNKRVLDQGADPTVPLFERLGFISIFWSNLQEFFMIRVGSLTDLALVKKAIIDSKSGMTPAEQLDAVYARCHELYPYYEKCYSDLRSMLTAQGIVNLTQKDLTEDQAAFAADYFTANVMPFLSPQIINARHPFPHLENGALYIVVRLDEQASSKGEKQKDGKKKKGVKNLGAEGVTLGIIPLPRQCKRIVQIPGDGLQFMLLEHLIEMFVPRIFSMYKVKHTNVICVTRNADLDANEGIEEQGEDYREHMKRILKKRGRLAPVRLESERELSATVKPVLMERLNLKANQLFVTSVPLNMSYAFELPALVDAEKRAKLTYQPFTPQWPSVIDRNRSIIDQVADHDVLISYPYETMDSFVQLLREAVADPNVISIKITLYRLAKQSHLAEALIAAADAGKEVTALFELRARFDESNNIEWSQRFDQAGCNVLYGFRDYKVHSKICCITRQTEDGLQYITQLGTGNYNEKTAKLYTDFSFITTDQSIGLDAVRFFRNMALENTSDDYDTLWVAPLQIKQNIMAEIDDQIAKHRAGLPSGIFFKTNSITDKDIIDKVVEASQAGVRCTMLVRGISCIVPGIPGYTENVCVDSIVGRLLEHSRIYCFGPFDGDVKVYLSSADLMTRNMDKRIEIAWPIENEEIRDQVIGYIGICMADTAKLRDLLPTRVYTDLGFFAKPADSTGRVQLFDSQSYLIDEAQRKRLEASELISSRFTGNSDLLQQVNEAEIDVEQLSDVLGEEVVEFQTIGDLVAQGSQDDYAMQDELVMGESYVTEAEYVTQPEYVAASEYGAQPEIVEMPAHMVGSEYSAEAATEAQPIIDSLEDPILEPAAESVVEPVVEAAVESELQPIVDPTTEPVVETSQKAAMDPIVEQRSESYQQAVEEQVPIAENTAVSEGAIAEFEVQPLSDITSQPISELEPVNNRRLQPLAALSSLDARMSTIQPMQEAMPEVVQDTMPSQTVESATEFMRKGTLEPMPEALEATPAAAMPEAAPFAEAPGTNASSFEVQSASVLQQEFLPSSLPVIHGAPTYEILTGEAAENAIDSLDIPNFSTGEVMSVAIDKGEDAQAQPSEQPKKRSLFNKIFGD